MIDWYPSDKLKLVELGAIVCINDLREARNPIEFHWRVTYTLGATY